LRVIKRLVCSRKAILDEVVFRLVQTATPSAATFRSRGVTRNRGLS
jgi:hypothetical protein